ncbi:hypothetical protein D3C85_1400810 [compost metagenome]
MLAQYFAKQAHQFATARRRHIAPVQKGRMGGVDSAGDRLFALQGKRCDLAAVDGRKNSMSAAVI